MKPVKKILALILAGVMALALLTGCGKAASPDRAVAEGVADWIKYDCHSAYGNTNEISVSYQVPELRRDIVPLFDTNWMKTTDDDELNGGAVISGTTTVTQTLQQRLRNYENSMTVAMKDSLRFYLRNRERGIEGKNLVMGLIADQNPPRRPDSHWFRFLNQDTIFFDGGEKLALRCNLPVYFVRMERLQRGRYQMSFEPIYDGVEEVAEYEITERYVRRLEAMICEHPELWMWSHRRWKHKRTNANR